MLVSGVGVTQTCDKGRRARLTDSVGSAELLNGLRLQPTQPLSAAVWSLSAHPVTLPDPSAGLLAQGMLGDM